MSLIIIVKGIHRLVTNYCIFKTGHYMEDTLIQASKLLYCLVERNLGSSCRRAIYGAIKISYAHLLPLSRHIIREWTNTDPCHHWSETLFLIRDRSWDMDDAVPSNGYHMMLLVARCWLKSLPLSRGTWLFIAVEDLYWQVFEWDGKLHWRGVIMTKTTRRLSITSMRYIYELFAYNLKKGS